MGPEGVLGAVRRPANMFKRLVLEGVEPLSTWSSLMGLTLGGEATERRFKPLAFPREAKPAVGTPRPPLDEGKLL